MSTARALPVERPPRRGLERLVWQNPLILTHPSLAGLEPLAEARPISTVFVGIGLCNEEALSSALPIDVLGILLPAERVRRALGARRLLVMVADANALANGFEPAEVEESRRRVGAALQGVQQGFGLDRMEVIHSSSFHASLDYLAILARFQAEAREALHPYVIQQLADVDYLRQRHPGLLKVGWSLSDSPSTEGRDEQWFDAHYERLSGQRLPRIYCRAGRSFDERRPRTAPYLVLRPGQRICLRQDEPVRRKLERVKAHGHTPAIEGALAHLRRLVREARAFGACRGGPVEQRIAEVVDRVAPIT